MGRERSQRCGWGPVPLSPAPGLGVAAARIQPGRYGHTKCWSRLASPHGKLRFDSKMTEEGMGIASRARWWEGGDALDARRQRTEALLRGLGAAKGKLRVALWAPSRHPRVLPACWVLTETPLPLSVPWSRVVPAAPPGATCPVPSSSPRAAGALCSRGIFGNSQRRAE